MMISPDEVTRLHSVFDESFKFKIGDVVTRKSTLATMEAEAAIKTKLAGIRAWTADMKGIPIAYTIIEQLLERCPGGVQKHYVLTADLRTKDGKVPLRENVNEVDVVLYSEIVKVSCSMTEKEKI